MAQELSLMELFNKLAQQQTIYGEKIEYLYDIFNANFQIPSEVTNSNDAPGMWPETGLNVYMILPEYTLAVDLCTSGVLFNIGKGRYKYQFMLVQSDELHPVKNGKIYYRYAKESANEWSSWKRWVYKYELDDGRNPDGTRTKDDFGKDTTDTEDEDPSKNKHNNNGGSGPNESIDKVNHAFQADQLTVPRKIELDGRIVGAEYFDGSKDIVINTKFAKEDWYVPINVQIEPKFRNVIEYHLLAELPAPTANTYDYVNIVGHIGGWKTDNGKAWITVNASNCKGADSMVNGLAVGTLSDCDIVAYKTSAGTLRVYLAINGWAEDIRLSVYGSKQAVVGDTIVVLSSSETRFWSLQKDGFRIEGNAGYGDLHGTADHAILSDKADTLKMNDNTSNKNAYLVAVDEGEMNSGQKYGDCYANKNIEIQQNGHIRASGGFTGNLTGNASSATTSAQADKVQVAEQQSDAVYLLGTKQKGTVYTQPQFNIHHYMVGNKLMSEVIDVNTLDAKHEAVDNLEVRKNGSLTVNQGVKFVNTSEDTWFNMLHAGNYNGDGTNGYIKMGTYGRMIWGKDSGNPTVIFNPDGIKSDGSVGLLKIAGALRPTRCYNAVYNDYAELFPCKEKDIHPGDVFMLDMESDTENYVKSTEHAKCVVGVYSDTYGYLMGGDEDEIDWRGKYVPIGLSGRVRVNVVGKVEKGDKLVATDDGCARVYRKGYDDIEDIIGYVLESDNLTTKRRLNMKIK